MSASTEKQTRRDIRRAMGPEALDMVGHQAKAIAQLQTILEIQAHRLTALYEAHRLFGNRLQLLEEPRTFWQRLRGR